MLGFILMTIVGIFAVALAIAAIRFLFEIALRAVAVTTIVVLAAIIGGIVASEYGYDGDLSGLAIAALAIFPAFMIVRSWRGSIADRLNGRNEKPVPLPSTSSVPTKPIEEIVALDDADALVDAWEDAQRLAPREVFGEDRKACAKFLAHFAASADCDPAAIELATLIRRHLPELVSATRAVADGAARDERREVIAAMVADIRQVGEDARTALSVQHAAARERLGVRQTLFAARVKKQEKW